MAKQPKKAVLDLKDRAITAGYILGGQAGAATLNAFLISNFLSGKSSTVQSASRVAIPAITGLILASTKNKHLQNSSLGFGVQGTLELIRLLVPGFSPSEPQFSDASSYVYTSDGEQVPLYKRNDGRYFVPIAAKPQITSGDGNEDESKMVGESLEVGAQTAEEWIEI